MNRYEVIAAGEKFGFRTLRVMAGFARSLERHGIAVERCQVRYGSALAVLKRSAWT